MPTRKEVCACSILERASRDPDHVIRWDETMNEYYIAHGRGGRMRVYYCPFCGGSTPKSRRASLFAHITTQEKVRLCQQCDGLRVTADVLERFGPPDEEREFSSISHSPGREEESGKGELFRGLVYQSLSLVADVVFEIGRSDAVHCTWRAKYRGSESL